jgi:RNA polymerase sigma factor (sigma-70 family)
MTEAGDELERDVESAAGGDREALERVLAAVRGPIYNLAVRMLWCPDDAADATQEILIRIVTRLATFRRESAFRTWVFRVATNHLLNVRRSRVEREELSFGDMAGQLAEGLADPPTGAAYEADQPLLVEEVRIGCTQAMLLCLDRDLRIAYVLGDVFELSGDEAAEVLDVAPAAYRKRLSRARERLRSFMLGHCGLVNRERPCRCSRRVPHAVTIGRVRPDNLLFAGRGSVAAVRPRIGRELAEMEDLHRVAGIFRGHPSYEPPESLLTAIRDLLDGGEYSILSDRAHNA